MRYSFTMIGIKRSALLSLVMMTWDGMKLIYQKPMQIVICAISLLRHLKTRGYHPAYLRGWNIAAKQQG